MPKPVLVKQRPLGCLGLLLCLAGCPAPFTAVRPYPAPAPHRLLSALAAPPIASARLWAKADVPDEAEKRVKLDVAFLVKRPSQLRLAAENVLAGPLLTFATDGQRFQLLDVKNGRYVDSVLRPCSLARLLRVAVPPGFLIEVLLGGVPMLSPEPGTVQVTWDPHAGGRERVQFRDAQGRHQVLSLRKADQPAMSSQGSKQPTDGSGPAAEPIVFDVVESTLFGEDQKPLLRIVRDRFFVVDAGAGLPGLRFPKHLSVEDVPNKHEVRLRIKEVEVPQPPLAPELFLLPKPDGTTQDVDTCTDGPGG